MPFRTLAASACVVIGLLLPVDASHQRISLDSPPAQPIEWNKDRKLKWQDFAAQAPGQSPDACHSWVGFDISWTCDEGTFVFHVKTTFDPAQSWVRSGAQQNNLLRHEQTHFDLTEVAARQIRKGLTEMGDACISYAAMGAIDRLIADEHRSWEQEQQLYDRETRNGTNDMSQRSWNQRTQRRLDQLTAFE